MLREGGSLLTMTCLSAVRAVPHYEVMGLAKASLTARVRYLAAATRSPQPPRQHRLRRPHQDPGRQGIRDFNKLLDYAAQNAPLRRNVTIEEVGNTAAFLCSDLASGITGEVWYVDAGHHITAMPVPG